MSKIIIGLFIFLSLSSCSDQKDKTKKDSTSSNPVQSSEVSNADKVIKEWLEGKEWKAEHGGAPFSAFKLFKDGHIEYGKTIDDGWSYADGLFGVHMNRAKKPQVTWPFKKVDEQSFTLYVTPTKETFLYQFVKNL